MKENRHLTFKNTNISLVAGLSEEISRLEKRIDINHLSEGMGPTYCCSLRDLCLYTQSLLDGLELDEVIDYLLFLKENGSSWAKIKLDVAH